MSEMIERVAIAIASAEAQIMFGADRSQVTADPRALAKAALVAASDWISNKYGDRHPGTICIQAQLNASETTP